MAADRLGRKRLLLGALLVYSLFGTAPLYLPSLPGIVLSRIGLGLSEALVMTICTTLIGDYFEGKQREFWLSLQGALSALAAAVFFGVGGALGSFGWRAPFWLYMAGLLLFPLVLMKLWEPALHHNREARVSEMPWPVLAVAFPFAIITGASLLTVPIQLSFLLQQMGVHTPAVTGLLSAGNQASVLAGALLCRLLLRLGYAGTFASGCLAAGGGLLLVGAAHGQPGLLAGGCLNGLGCGILLVGLINWALAVLPAHLRGAGTGGFSGCVFLGEFLSPLIILAIRHAGCSLAQSIGLCGWALLVLTLPALLAPRAGRQRLARS